MQRRFPALAAAWLALAAMTAPAAADTFETFEDGAEARWQYIADSVMGGVSDGQAVLERDGTRRYLRLTGNVSTENNGGFIQAQRRLPDGLPAGTEALTLTLRGNGETYYVFLRTEEMRRPWNYHSIAFTADAGWGTVRLPLSDFTRSHRYLADRIDPETVISIGLVAYGKDYAADLSVADVALQ